MGRAHRLLHRARRAARARVAAARVAVVLAAHGRLALWLIAEITVRPKAAHTFFWLGTTMGALALTRENALVFIVVILLWALFANPQSPIPNPLRVKRAALFLAGLAIVLAPVAARN